MKQTIIKPDGTVITIRSKDKELVEKIARGVEEDIEKANRFNKVEPIERIVM